MILIALVIFILLVLHISKVLLEKEDRRFDREAIINQNSSIIWTVIGYNQTPFKNRLARMAEEQDIVFTAHLVDEPVNYKTVF